MALWPFSQDHDRDRVAARAAGCHALGRVVDVLGGAAADGITVRIDDRNQSMAKSRPRAVHPADGAGSPPRDTALAAFGVDAVGRHRPSRRRSGCAHAVPASGLHRGTRQFRRRPLPAGQNAGKG